jgi:hypothetical protein
MMNCFEALLLTWCRAFKSRISIIASALERFNLESSLIGTISPVAGSKAKCVSGDSAGLGQQISEATRDKLLRVLGVTVDEWYTLGERNEGDAQYISDRS